MRITGNNSTVEVRVDGIGALVEMDSFHHQIHDADAFNYSVYAAALPSATVADGSSAYNITLRTGATKEAHLAFSVYTGGLASVELYRGSSISGAGTAVTPENRDSGSTKVSALTVLTNSSSTGTTGLGTQRVIGLLPGGVLVDNKLLGGGGGGRDEWILATATTHVFRVTNLSTGDAGIAMNIGLSWYERG